MTGTFDNDEQLLLLYMADELSPADRAELDARLGRDPALAQKLDRLASIQLEIEARLERLDRSVGAVRADVIARQIGRELRQRLASPKVQLPSRSAPPRHRMLPWLIPSGIAAAFVVGMFAWMHHRAMVNEFAFNRPPEPPASRPIERQTTLPTDSEANLALLESSFNSDDDTRALARVDSSDELSGYLLNLEAAH
jgi:anti-sigma factor RsiW